MLLGCCRCTMSLEDSGEEERGAAAAAPGGGTTSGGSSADSHSGGVVKVEAPVLQRRRSSTRRAAEPRSALAGEDAGVGASRRVASMEHTIRVNTRCASNTHHSRRKKLPCGSRMATVPSQLCMAR